ncbi:MAG TPA: YdcF family protein [Candidatus Sulfotelmatobacter sp.]|nr:YdcF family protein [Candidatus Sulfotelmatobacter sp.]
MKFVADPVFWLWLGGVAVTVRLAVRRRWGWAALLGSLVALACAAEAVKLPARLLSSLEQPYLCHGSLPVPAADAVVVLGGYMERFSSGYLGMELNEAADRLLTGIALVREGKGRALVLGGGGRGHPPQPEEAQCATKWMQEWHLVSVPVENLGVSLNTHDEALHLAELAKQRGWKKIVLVTSAWHMKRAAATFRKAGFEVVPVGSDFQGTCALEGEEHIHFVPRSGSLVQFSRWLEEQIGYVYYRVRGWAG